MELHFVGYLYSTGKIRKCWGTKTNSYELWLHEGKHV
jgi:hypothetical protein